MLVGISPSSCWRLCISNVGRAQCHESRPRISCLYVCMYLYFYVVFPLLTFPKGREVVCPQELRCAVPHLVASLAISLSSLSHSHSGGLALLRWGEEQTQALCLLPVGVEKGQMLPSVPPEQEVWVGRALVWEAGVLAAATNWGCVCRLPGSGVPIGTSSSEP